MSATPPPTTGRASLKYQLLLLVMAMIWGSAFAAQQIGMEKGLGPMTFNGLRFTLGCLSLLPVMRWGRRFLPIETDDGGPQGGEPGGAPEQSFPLRGSLIAGVLLFLAASFQQVGLLYTSSANAGFITGLYIVFVPLIGGLFIGQRIERSLWIGVVVCLVGLSLLSVPDTFEVSIGDVLVLICAVLWAAQILVIGDVAHKGDPIRIAFLQFAVCAVLSLLASVFETWTWAAIRDGSGAVAYAGFLSVGVAFTLQVICQQRCPPAPAAVIMSMEAVFAAITGYVVLSQTLTVRAIIGCLLILAGMLYVQLAPMLARDDGRGTCALR